MSFVPVVSSPYEPNPKYINSFTYSVNELQLSKQITFNVVLFDQNKLPLCAQLITMGGEDYANWGSDDSYVIHFICSKLGLTPLSDITPPVPPVSIPLEPTPEPTPLEPTPESIPVEPTPENVTPASDPNEINYIENIPVDIL